MTNKRYFVPPNFINNSFSEEEIREWNCYLYDNYKIWILFERICLNHIAAGRKYLSARDIISKIRMERRLPIKNAVSAFLAFMFCMKYPQHEQKFIRAKRKALA